MDYTTVEHKCLKILGLPSNKIYTQKEMFDTYVTNMIDLHLREQEFLHKIGEYQLSCRDIDKCFKNFKKKHDKFISAYYSLSQDEEINDIIC